MDNKVCLNQHNFEKLLNLALQNCNVTKSHTNEGYASPKPPPITLSVSYFITTLSSTSAQYISDPYDSQYYYKYSVYSSKGNTRSNTVRLDGISGIPKNFKVYISTITYEPKSRLFTGPWGNYSNLSINTPFSGLVTKPRNPSGGPGYVNPDRFEPYDVYLARFINAANQNYISYVSTLYFQYDHERLMATEGLSIKLVDSISKKEYYYYIPSKTIAANSKSTISPVKITVSVLPS